MRARDLLIDKITIKNHNGFLRGFVMPMSIMLKNVPDNIYAILKSNAESNRRSLNSETIVCLETFLLQTDVPVSERLARIQRLTSQQDPKKMASIDIDKAKREGRA
jgi:antitoxin FitA